MIIFADDIYTETSNIFCLFQATFMLAYICPVIPSISHLIIYLTYLIRCIFACGEISVMNGASLSPKT